MDAPQSSFRSLPPGENPPAEWKRVGLRKTPQRELVLGLVRSCADHPTAEWIFREARRVIPDISLATVYRTLRILKERGLIHEFSGGASPSRFDGTLQGHEHVRCVRCGVVIDVDLPDLGDIREMVAERTGFRVARYPLLFHGLCRECAVRNGDGLGPASGAAPGSILRGEGAGERGDLDDPDRHWVEGYW